MFFRDSVHLALEDGKFASRFPMLFKTFSSDWQAEDVPELERELREIQKAFRSMPPEPPDANWRAKLRQSGRRPVSLAEVYVDKGGAPLLDRLIALAQTARDQGLPIRWGSEELAQGKSAGSAQRSQSDERLLAAVAAGDLELARAALAAGASPNAIADERDEPDRMWSHTPALHAAVTRGNAAMVELLLNNGADPNGVFERRGIVDFEKRPCLVDALKHPHIAAMLLRAGADPNLPSIWGEDSSNETSPLAHGKGNLELERLLKSYGATQTDPPESEITPVMIQAGVREFWGHDNQHESAEVLVMRVYRAMIDAKTGSGLSKDQPQDYVVDAT